MSLTGVVNIEQGMMKRSVSKEETGRWAKIEKHREENGKYSIGTIRSGILT